MISGRLEAGHAHGLIKLALGRSSKGDPDPREISAFKLSLMIFFPA